MSSLPAQNARTRLPERRQRPTILQAFHYIRGNVGMAHPTYCVFAGQPQCAFLEALKLTLNGVERRTIGCAPDQRFHIPTPYFGIREKFTRAQKGAP